ncbi:MAG TPA: protein kinase [Thermoanaerobaculales bacterium]|nr:protein kinase [Thermoanaerobaculales bacterium]
MGEIGRGGMGVVYQARDLVLGRHVALKTPLTDPQRTARWERRFLREAQAASKVSHPGVVSVFEAFEHDGRLWLAMELVEGEALSDVLRRRKRLPLPDLLDYQESLAAGLHAAHSKMVLHRDIKPSNILITSDGIARLTDFGLARIGLDDDALTLTMSEPRESLTEDGKVVGTLAYMAPEQVLGRGTDERSDIFSLGAVFHEMCTGQRAFPGSGRGSIIDLILHVDPRPPRESNPEIPDELERIIRKCLAKRPAERYQSAQELWIDLRSLRRRSSSTASMVRSPSRARSKALLAAAAVAVAAVAGVVTLSWLAGPRLPAFGARKVTDRAGLEEQPAISPRGTEIAYCTTEAGNQDIWIADANGGNPLRLTDHAAADHSPAWFPDGSALAFVSDRSGSEAVWKVPRFGGTAVLLIEDAADADVSPRGTSIAFSRFDDSGFSRIWIADLSQRGLERQLTGPDQGLWDHFDPAWSPDGKTICYNDFRDLWLVDADGGSPHPLTADDPLDTEPVWSPDGRHIYFTSYRSGTYAIWRVDVEGGELAQLTLGMGPERTPSLSRDGHRMAYTTQSEVSSITLVDRTTGDSWRIDDERFTTEPAIAPDRGAVAYVSARANAIGLWSMRLVDNRPSGPPLRLTEHEGSCASPSYSPDGRWIAYHRVIGGQRDVWVVPATGGLARPLTGHPATDVLPSWSPDGSRIAFSSDRDGATQIWTVPFAGDGTVAQAARLTSGGGTDLFPVWSTDGSVIAFVRYAHDGSDVWRVPADGSAAPIQVTNGAAARFLCWDRLSDRLLVSGMWGGTTTSVRSVDLVDGIGSPVPDAVPRTPLGEIVDFDLSVDGRLLALNETERRGDIWVLETEATPF